MAERWYSHTADPRLNCQLPSGELVKRGSTVRIDLAECPEWSAPVKWVRLGWLTAADEPHESEALLKDGALPTVDNAPPPSNDNRMLPEEWLASHTVMELRAMCSDRGIPYGGLRKTDLIEAIMEHD